MATVLYTTTEAIRAAVGVTTKELPDALLLDQRLELQTKTSLYRWLPGYAALYAAGIATDATSDEQHVSELLTLYCIYFGAVRAVEMILAYRQTVGDGKQEVSRFTIDWAALLQTMKDRLDEVTEALEDVLGMGGGSTAYFGKAVPDYDPVTNT